MEKPQSPTAKFMNDALKKKHGARGTRQRMHSTYKQLERIAKEGKWGPISPKSITHKQVAIYVAKRIEEGISAHSIQTEVSAIRRAMEGAGRHIDAVNLFTSVSLGVPPVSRKGDGIPISETTYLSALERADRSTAALMRLQHDLGLRLNEAIEVAGTLSVWEKTLRAGATHVHLLHGSKGGRPRYISILPQNFDTAYRAIVTALALTNGGRNFPIQANNGRHAARLYSQKMAELGIKNEESSHSMRRRFACNQYEWYLQNGLTSKEALARLSMDLGHGDGRGRWVHNNYVRNGIDAEKDRASGV
jgi:site-specific recombinase XerC